ncbi:DUF2635 domain-containing protein [Denitromonas halophila]|uniref:DUF2635 domain-containing protein n=1 Tax=Denitromonas halophila TaxID=1629404 RepID=A0A557QXG4_9RHOO|nr:DUF2635 domain-containing protein [Denitromonas halophila]TVO57526.1 DUF2635 domain-containing protein [Denitromonas halophila]
MIVTAKPGVRVPIEGKPRKYITEAETADVPDTAYYRRRLRDGDLIIQAEAKTPAKRKEA